MIEDAPPSILPNTLPSTVENDPALWCAALPALEAEDNKYTRGHAVLWGGYPMTGAARLAARAAARSGAGLTTIAVPNIALPIYATALVSIMVHPVSCLEDFINFISDERMTAFLIGPGAGSSSQTKAKVLSILGTGRAALLDADALNSFQSAPDHLFQAIEGPCVLTPHEGEFSRLFDLTGDKVERGQLAARLSGAVIVLKGPRTVIAAPDGKTIINTNAPPTLATAGAGDVLSGIIVGLLAQGMAPFEAAAAGVWLHGEAANTFGPGLIAEDIPEMLPRVFSQSLAASFKLKLI